MIALDVAAVATDHRFEPRGAHWLVDYHGVKASMLCDAPKLEGLLRDAALVAGAQVLSSHFHRFGHAADALRGVTGVVVLAESHITIHTWPEREFAAIDLFLCGTTQPQRALDHLRAALAPSQTTTTRCVRGLGIEHDPMTEVAVSP